MNFSEHLGPLPAWGWLVVVAGGVGGYVLIKKFAGGQSAAVPTTTADGSNTGAPDLTNALNAAQTQEQTDVANLTTALTNATGTYQQNLTTAVAGLTKQEQADMAAITGQLQTQSTQQQNALQTLSGQVNTELSTLNQQLNTVGQQAAQAQSSAQAVDSRLSDFSSAITNAANDNKNFGDTFKSSYEGVKA